MNIRTFTVVMAVVVVLIAGFIPPSQEQRFQVSYTIEPQSNLYIKGTTNINSFECVSLDAFRVQHLKGTYDPSTRKATFSGATLKLQVKKLDCDNSKMNKDLCEALNEEVYPTIIVSLHAASLTSPSLGTSTTDITADATLEISGVKRKVQFQTKGRRLADDAYQFTAEKTILMSDFGVDPPTALFGLIKVDDEIAIHLDIVTRAVTKEN